MGAIDRPACEHCGNRDDKTIKLRRIVTGSGVSLIAWRCLVCNHWAHEPVRWIKHEGLREWLKTRYRANVDDIPAIEDYRGQAPCVICGAPGEWHHFAPQAWANQFGDEWHLWPCVYLCRYHHQMWHRIVTPALVGIKQEAA